MHTIGGSFGGGFGQRFARVLGCRETEAQGDPAVAGSTIVGFVIAQAEPTRRLVLEGEHRFSRYRFSFEIEPAGDGSRVVATTDAEFPGLKGELYKTAVVRSRFHVLAVRRILDEVRRRT